MAAGVKTKKRGFVMTGGGAKGLYEAGVIHAFHVTGMEFEVITGSSIGAMNSIFMAEYLWHKKRLSAQYPREPERVFKELNERVMAYHHAWLQMPDRRIVDDSPTGPIGKLKDDVLNFNLSLPLITRLGWWWTDPKRGFIIPPETWSDLVRLVDQLFSRLNGVGALLKIIFSPRGGPVREMARAYLSRFGMERSLIPPEDNKLKDIFTLPVTPLTEDHLTGDTSQEYGAKAAQYALVDPNRTLGDFARVGISVRVTRANYRTGRLEVSAYVPLESFVRFLEKQAWRVDAYGLDRLPLGSFRLQIPGNPNAINAGLCSGRFPGVFAPFPVTEIYPKDDPENAVLYKLFANWLNDEDVAAKMKSAFKGSEKSWDSLYQRWKNSESMRSYFPNAGDVYVDGGTIDNTPSNSAVDYVRERIDQEDQSRRDVSLELFVIFLETEPKVKPEEVGDPAIFEVVSRTLAIQGVAKNSADSNTVSTINTFGERSEHLASVLKTLLTGYQEMLAGIDADPKRQAQQNLYEAIRQLDLHEQNFPGASPENVLETTSQWVDGMLKRLPVQVETVKIFPEEMPLSTLQFTERLGYRKANAIKMLTMGCYNTLWALRARLEEQADKNLDDLDRQVLSQARKCMGDTPWPEEPAAQATFSQEWRCTRHECVYHAHFCPRGATKG